MMTRRLQNLALCLLIFSGCQPREPGVVTAADRPASSQNHYEWFILIAEGLPLTQRQEILNELGLLLERAAVGDVINVFRCPDHTQLGTMIIPEGNRRGSPALSKSLSHVVAFLTDETTVPQTVREQLNLPMLVDSFWAVRRTELPPRIILCGAPLYHDEKDTVWDLRQGAPSPSSLTNPNSTLPHRLLSGTAPLPDTTEVRWLTPTERWGQSTRHQEALTQFYRDVFAGFRTELVAISSKAEVIFRESSPSQFPEYRSVEDRLPPRMIVFPAASVPVKKNASAVVSPHPAQSLSTLLEAAKSDSSKSLIAISWSGPVNTDIDLWVGAKDVPGSEIMFKNPVANFGVLHRDVRSPLSEQIRAASAIDEVESAWEAVSLTQGQQLNDIELYLNAYEAIGPVTVKMLIVVDGQLDEKQITIPCTAGGDQAQNHERRDSHSAWVKVDLLDIVGQSQNEVNR